MKTAKRILSISLVMITIALTAITGFAAYENTYKNTGNQRADIIGVAKTQLGYTEGYNNDTKYGTWYGLPNQPWCAMFVSWCARQASIPTSVLKNSACAGAGSDYFDIPYYNGSSYSPQPGDLFFTKSWSHVGLVSSVDGAYFYSIEGNSNSNGSSEGVAVVSNKRKISNFYFGVPNYNPDYKIDTRFPTPFIARTLSTGKVTCYDSVNGRGIGRIYPSDDVTVQEVYTNGWVKGSCPWTGGGYKTIFVKRNVFINSSNAPKKYTASQKTYTYLRSSDSSTWGWIDPGDVCYSIYKSGNRTMVLYPTSSGTLRLAWTTSTLPVTTYSLDLNSSVDGTKVWDLNGIGTADVYIDGSLKANDCSDFCQAFAKGTKYIITDIRAKSGYTYTGTKTISGTLNGNRDITLTFKKTVSGWSTNFLMKAGAYMNAYDGVNGSKVGRVYPNDVVTVKYVYNSGWMKLVCPWSDSSGSYNRTVYCQINGFKFNATQYIRAYDGINGSSVGRVYPNDIVTVKELYSSGWMKCVCPWTGNTNKTIFIKLAEIY